MRWLKVKEAAGEWCGGLSTKTVYAAIRSGRLKAVRVGAGRNFLLCEEWCTQWLIASATSPGGSHAEEPQLAEDAAHPVDIRQRRAAR